MPVSFADLRQRIGALQDKALGRGATAEEMANAGRVLKVSFSGSYEQFLREYGWARFGHERLSPYSALAIGVYGLGSGIPPHLDLLKNTVAERTENEPSLPAHLVPVMGDGGGNHYCLDTSKMVNGEYPMIFWDHENDEEQATEPPSQSFESWLINQLDDEFGVEVQKRGSN
jgi:hypothetical protein